MKGALEKLRKILLWKPGRVLLAVGCCGLLLLALIPLFRLTIYAVPYYDDYNFGRFARAAIEQEQSKWAAISGALDCSRTQWYAWQGTYSSIFFMTLMPAVWGEQYYFLGPVFILLLLLAGSNFVTALQGLLCLLTILLVSVVVERRRTGLWLLPSTLVYIIGFGMNVAAPGNSVRARSYVGWGYGPLESIGRSFLEAVKHIPEYTGPVVLMVMLLLVPMIWQALKSTDYRFRYPGIVLALSFCLYATGYTPSLYSLGHAGLSRTLNAVKITYLMLLFFNEIYWCGWLKQILEKRTDKSAQKLSARNGAAVWWYYVHTGQAYNFHQEYLERVKRLSGNARNVHLPAYRFKPWFLCMGDISEDAHNEANCSLAMWYHKDSVTLKEKD